LSAIPRHKIPSKELDISQSITPTMINNSLVNLDLFVEFSGIEAEKPSALNLDQDFRRCFLGRQRVEALASSRMAHSRLRTMSSCRSGLWTVYQ
jgi:hypothetical protein